VRDALVSAAQSFSLGHPMNQPLRRIAISFICFGACCAHVRGQEASIRVDARAAGKPVSRLLAGACIEDVNHEIYGGIYSQMLFGESFQEPPAASPVTHFTVAGGDWAVNDGELSGGAGPGPKLVSGAVQALTDRSRQRAARRRRRVRRVRDRDSCRSQSRHARPPSA
jgi:hypothetical protein